MKHFQIKKGEHPQARLLPAHQISRAPQSQRVALLGTDVPGLQPHFEVSETERVTVGQVLFTDRKHRQVAFVSPVCGLVSKLSFGARRTLSEVIIDVDGAAADDRSAEPDAPQDETRVREVLLERGLWPAFRTRPFGRIPHPEGISASIFVSAAHASPTAPDPWAVLDGKLETFRRGVSLLSHLTEGRVFVCQSPGTPLGPVEGAVVHASFAGTTAAGFASTHIECLSGIPPGGEVWTIGFQDVLAIGHLFETGHYMSERVVSVVGGSERDPRLLRCSLGADVDDICAQPNALALPGAQQVTANSRYLGRYHDQISVVERPARSTVFSGLSRRHEGAAIIASAALERAIALDIPAVPLARALSIGDCETADRLGCLSLVEEDVAALSRRCTSGADYGALLRQVLDQLAAEAA